MTQFRCTKEPTVKSLQTAKCIENDEIFSSGLPAKDLCY